MSRVQNATRLVPKTPTLKFAVWGGTANSTQLVTQPQKAKGTWRFALLVQTVLVVFGSVRDWASTERSIMGEIDLAML